MRDVVTAVLKRGDKILLVKRGVLVNTFKEKWSCISGRMESTPLESVLKEIYEETGLSSNQVTLVKEGKVLQARGEHIQFRVHPFLFEVNCSEIRLNWENTEYRWVHPEEIGTYETVPRLRETIESVLNEWDLT
ncbi:MAG: NUDIX domain-containing protein [Theionarchaea archaeon]|nr:NUDIX domain-containing protein [Theionarchaea archaeon]MBU7001739.1 NUDIX domain-containing protein [Theionarchaea archaeon]MBU7020967.1 NUDIX domain-containing protein [Theionarchaea archaeon]MBU7034395.1 NUDIX domain-containing protein [Theionarchaea archaeon]MBU7040042.1 NUDIX domain-containing protein [Theionarchaea archaeon]